MVEIIEILSFLAIIISIFYIASIGVIIFPCKKSKENNKTPLISVIIATKNEEDVIERTLQALKKSDYPKFEIIIIDSSKDNTEKIARKYTNKIFIDKKGIGKANALNLGVKHARGELVYIIDADSIVEKDTIKKLVRSLGTEYSASIGLNLPINKKGFLVDIGRLESGFLNAVNKIISCIANTGIIPGRNYIIYKNTLKKLGGYKNVLTEDLNLAWRLYRSNKKVTIADAPIYEQIPDKLEWYVKQQERWSIGGLKELAKSIPYFSLKEKVFLIPLLIFLTGIPITIFLSLILFFLTYSTIFLSTFIISLVLLMITAIKYLDYKDALLSPVTSVTYAFLQTFVTVFSIINLAFSRKIQWYKTPREKYK